MSTHAFSKAICYNATACYWTRNGKDLDSLVTALVHADALGWLSYLRPATEQLQRLDLSRNPLLKLSSASE